MIRRRSSISSLLPATPDQQATRRRDDRLATSERIHFLLGERQIPGWTLNVSVGGIRAIIEEQLAPGTDLGVVLGGAVRPGRVVWVQEEPDGSIVGVCFLDTGAPATPDLLCNDGSPASSRGSG